MTALPITRESWAAALRSGEYEQATEGLKVGSAYCCLGVACVLVGLKDDPLLRRSGTWWEASRLRGDLEREMLAALDMTLDQERYAARLNDNGASFSDIAGWIDAGMPLWPTIFTEVA